MYRAVENRVAVVLSEFRLPISEECALEILCQGGFRQVRVDVCEIARARVSVVQYRRGARMCEAPQVMDCSSMMKWVYGQMGICIPRRSIQQRALGRRVSLDEVQVGDLVFVSGWQDWYDDNPGDGVGHVGIVVGDNQVIHAANRKVGVITTPLDRFTDGCFRGAARFVEDWNKLFVFECPARWEVETSDDLKWIVLWQL